ncbi:MAG: tyrosine--tRNA ligase [Bacillota bacterium]
MDAKEQVRILSRGAAEIVSELELEQKIQRGKPLRVKYGADPSAPDIHLGHTVPIRKLKHFQELGHEVYFIIGDFTGRIGDPSGRSETRRQLSEEEVLENAKTYKEQIFKILAPEKTRVLFNSSWLSPLTFVDVITLASKYTVARMLERDDFKKRMQEEKPVSIHEFLYPLAQAYDSVAIRADVELGGTDQTFNFLLTRDIQREYGVEPQVMMTMPLLEGTDGTHKMSKSLNNYIGINESPRDMYGKTMSIPDELMLKYYELVTDVPVLELRQIERQLRDGTAHPRDVKMRLAREIVSLYHGASAARQAEEEFVRVFQCGGLPEEMSEFRVSPGSVRIVRLMVDSGLAASNSEAKRLIAQGAVRVNQDRVSDPDLELRVQEEMIIQVGKRKYVRVTVG